ncbi:hypothetical protein BV22DRAFT_994558, partial [Leucogyrophana mollusca]
REPHLQEINHILRPLVDELLQFWHSGIFISRTADHVFGRLVRSAIIPLICDLPAIRKAAGFASFGSKEGSCSFCYATKDDFDNFDIKSFRPRTWKEHMRVAEQWLNAPSVAAREEHWRVHRIRWSELLRLPYWDPIQFPVVDSMHNLFLNEISHHCREALGMNAAKKVTPSFDPHDPTEQAIEI